jgi:DNA-binding response OmpR family regulator
MGAQLGPLRVLVIEDDAAIRETLGLVLESLGHVPALADGMRAAFDSLALSWPDVLLLDLTLEDVTGEEVYREIRKRFGRVPPTVVLSAVRDGEERTLGFPRGWGEVNFLSKPYSIDRLESLLEGMRASRAA